MNLRINNKISEDCYNNNSLSPFKDHKEILRPYLEYFCFTGTGSSDSKYPAENLIKFSKYNDPSTWKVFSKEETIDEIWDGFFFCMRDIGKGMPKNFNRKDPEKLLNLGQNTVQ